MTRYFSICGDELQPDEIDICDNCKASIMGNDFITPQEYRQLLNKGTSRHGYQ